MATIMFKGKFFSITDWDENFKYHGMKVPVFTRAHCDMAAFRSHPKYRWIANSDLFLNALARIRRDLPINGAGTSSEFLPLDDPAQPLPDNIHVDMSGFLAVVTVDV